MSEIIIKTRIVHKHDTEENWNNTVNFIPKNGELIIYDADANHQYKRMKIGDGVTNVKLLDFVNDELLNTISELTDEFESFNESTTSTLNNLQTQLNQGGIEIGSTKPTYACTWFNVTSEEPAVVVLDNALLDKHILA